MAVPPFVLPPIIAAGEGPDTDLIPTAVIGPGGGSFAAFRLFQGREPQTLSLMQQVAVAAVERIVDRRYPPGSHLAEHALAEEFHTSKAPVSEALVLVESAGLLDYASRRSARVAEMSLADFDDLMNYRRVLELPAGKGFIKFLRRLCRVKSGKSGRLKAESIIGP